MARASDLSVNTVLMTGHPDEIQTLTISNVFHLAKPFGLTEFERVIEDNIPH